MDTNVLDTDHVNSMLEDAWTCVGMKNIGFEVFKLSGWKVLCQEIERFGFVLIFIF
jgi:hypothetical protein